MFYSFWQARCDCFASLLFLSLTKLPAAR